MKWLHKQQLKHLLEAAVKNDCNEFVQAALYAALQSNLTSYMGPTAAIPTMNALEIYQRRAKYEDSPARGFDLLLKSLQNSTDAQVRIHSYMVNGDDYLIFTNPATTKLHGVLIVDVRQQLQAGWFDKYGRWKRQPSTERK